MSSVSPGVVTGAASGIGAAVADELGRAGRPVLLFDTSRKVHNVARRLRLEGVEAAAVVGDVTDFDRVQSAVQECVARWGRIDYLVACAGVLDTRHMVDGDPSIWRTTLEVNLLGVAYCIRAALPVMIEQGDGHLVLLASVSGIEAYAGEAIYIASKWGMVGMGESLRREVAGSGVRSTLISPGIVDTPLLRQSVMAQDWLSTIRPLEPSDVARAVSYVLSQPRRMVVNHLILRSADQVV